MSWFSLGSLTLPYQLQRQGVALRSDMARLGQELTTGQTANPQRHLQGDIAPLAAIETRLARIESFTQSSKSTALRVDAMQNAMGQLEAARSDISSKLLLSPNSGAPEDMLRSLGTSASHALGSAVSALSLSVAGQTAFSGTATDRAPLVPAAQIMSEISARVGALTTADAIVAEVNKAFHDAGELFDTSFYQGSEAGPGAKTSADSGDAARLPTAADTPIRAALSGLVIAALLADDTLAIDQDARQDLARQGALALIDAGPALTGMQAGLGDEQARLDAQAVQFTTERDALTSARQGMIGVDPYEAAMQLEQTRVQLETLYTVTARTSRLSLTEYLR
ncbi:flagellin [Pararhodobacter oceanensis]|uniref:Flagellin C-terminal domain-containing protein n=1 Tax=Pararhodobacter oceanensis TaxID=2172121 RepID=A0A2T8HRA3_9RHOB|nr:flagellin [Pararhodobacter oceanensis]PVH27872.1 hypothetical protein DDE20_15280 [Pararhodobacter oceanensis]